MANQGVQTQQSRTPVEPDEVALSICKRSGRYVITEMHLLKGQVVYRKETRPPVVGVKAAFGYMMIDCEHIIPEWQKQGRLK